MFDVMRETSSTSKGGVDVEEVAKEGCCGKEGAADACDAVGMMSIASEGEGIDTEEETREEEGCASLLTSMMVLSIREGCND